MAASALSRRGAGLVAALAGAGAAVALSVWATWPVAAHLSTRVYDPHAHGGFVAQSIRWDERLVLWILAWDVHALRTAPLRLFEANVFHPAPHALALSEHLLGALPVYAPLALLSGDPVFAHQATLLLTFVGAFGGAFALVRIWTGSTPAALLAGSLFAFSPFRGAHLGALQILGGWYLPLVVLAAWWSVASRRRVAPVALAAGAALVGLHSIYLAYAAFAGMGALTAALLGGSAGARARWRRLVLPLLAAGALVAAAAIPYVMARRAGALPPPPAGFVEFGSARLGHTGASLALAVAVATLPWWRRGLRTGIGGAWLVALAVAGAATHLLAAGPTLHVAGLALPGPYRLAAALAPGFASLRIPLRFDAFTTAALAILAGVGAAGVLAAIRTPAPRRLAAVATVLAAVAAARLGLPHPVPLEPIETRASLPGIVAVIASLPPGPLLELPWHDFERAPSERGADATRLYRSIHHWQPLLNGYSGYAPPTYAPVSALVEALPAPRALALLARTTGLRYVLVHRGERVGAARDPVEDMGELRRVAAVGPDLLLALSDPPPADLLERLRDGAGGSDTLTGTPLAPMPADGRRARVRGPLGRPRWLTRRRLRVVVEVTNASRHRWPALAVSGAHRVVLAARWTRASDGAAIDEAVVGRIPWDLAPGEAARVVAVVPPPAGPGPWRLVLGVAQDGRWFDGSVPLDVP